ncbi:MAG: chemotaxis protein CheW [Promethearchaeota archaeon]
MTTAIENKKTKGDRYLIFRISNDLYGLEVQYLKEVFQSENILKLPRTSAVLEGIVNLRGYIVSIFNLSVLLWGKESHKESKNSAKNVSKRKVILLLTIKEQDVGILVDQIHQLDTITDFETVNESYFQGRELLNPSLISQIGFLNNEQKVYILDLKRLLGGFIAPKKSSKKYEKADEEEDFDFDQYTLPDSDEMSDFSSGSTSDLEMNQLNLPENQLIDEFDQTVLDKAEVKSRGREKKEKDVEEKIDKNNDVKEVKKPEKDDNAKTDLKKKGKGEKTKRTKKTDEADKNNVVEADKREVEKSKKKNKIKKTKKEVK